MSKRKEYTTFDPRIHFKGGGGTGYQMKKNKKNNKKEQHTGKGPTQDGLEIAKVFGWDVGKISNVK
tara:strand:+ start:565 stop:762 length:198 start_codon:yes stop_codon:yes gene_type:complete